ncbi:sciellin isoform X2 [Hyperolius riggenbachi]|uniref:sciellin isoform X2 n=1 Tax=Hyperolius riggenbachi TaxID=752182 RepID=UPI0035A3C35F
MSTYTFNKSGNDSKSNTLGSMTRQNVIQETSKRRSFLTDNSWIKSRPEEEEEKIKDENFGRAILNRYKSQDGLERDNDNDEDRQTIHNRFKSDDALDRIPLRNTSERGSKAATLERMPMSGPDTTNKRYSMGPGDKLTTTSTTTTTTDDSKRKSWGPTNRGTSSTTTTTTTTTSENKPAVPGKQETQKITIYSSDSRAADKPTRTSFIDTARSRFEKADEKPSVPTSPPPKFEIRTEEKPKVTPLSPTARTNDRPPFPAKPVVTDNGERRTTVDRKQRSKDLENLIEVSSSKVVSNKGTQDMGNLIEVKPPVEKKRDQLDDLIHISDTSKSTNKRDQLDVLVEISDTTKNARKRDEELNKLIEIKPEKSRSQNLDNLIEIKNTTTRQTRRSEDFDDLIAISGEDKKGITKPAVNNTSNTTRSSTTTTTYNTTHDSTDLPGRRSTTTRSYNVTNDFQDLPGKRSTTTTTYKSSDDSGDIPGRRSSSSTSYKVTDNSSNVPTRSTTGPTTVTTYRDITDGNTRGNVRYLDGPASGSMPTFTQEQWTKSPHTFEQSITANPIKTVYSTSDRSVIEKDMCTYCRKPLGIDAKMILNDLNISCHATCFKCEACSDSLENLKAGDSMWIYKQTIHCEPCYFAAREKWII